MTTVKPSENKERLFSEKVRAEIDTWIAKYPEGWQQSAVMAALRIVQDENGGYLTQELMDQVAAYLDMPPIAVYEVATFYSMYEHKKVGKHKVCVCTNVSCMINGSDKIVEHMEKKLGIKLGEVTEDGKYSLKEVECLGACG
ncbi:MAG: NADH-quinone oxidoreductase subunit NuoE, partial [Sedimenticola sp.]|nr:NADH-quinone oxidoreductase subunit NuoE [Sedimenticola sp.]